jgi:ribonuclease R
VYCEPAKVGRGKGWRLLVAIADVSHYVETGSAIDVDAYDRATSVYFPRRVIPMLPEKLSNGLCSLNPEVERLCMVCDMLVTAAGRDPRLPVLSGGDVQPRPLHLHRGRRHPGQHARSRGHRRQERVGDLLNLHDVYRACSKSRTVRGAVDFETTETQIVCDESGRIEKIVPRTRNEAHRLIEEAMLAANVCSADFIAQGKHPGLFRVHEGPTPEKKEILRNYLKAIGVGADASATTRSPVNSRRSPQATKDRPDAQQIHSMLLRSMQQAIYTPVNSGHFGLAYEAYTHFTSPIRRYPDLLVHRVIKAILAQRRYQLPELPTPGEAHAKLAKRLQKGLAAKVSEPDQKPRKLTSDQLAWQAAGLHCSANERRADEASRDVEAWLKCKYMREHLGEEYGGVVTSAASFGIFVTLDELYVEGMVHITELGGEYFRFDEARQELRGERSGMRYAIGTRVRVQVSRVDLDGRKIDFRLVHDGEPVSARPARERDKGAPQAAPEAGSRGAAKRGVRNAPATDRTAGASSKGRGAGGSRAPAGKNGPKARKSRR